ncbi:hypothetical protein, partial [Pseudomonas reactans]|uniref:hypothetical protein n=1 Tax=Pseudomonas reactans TaxID=117680 RepID=UPI001C4316C3
FCFGRSKIPNVLGVAISSGAFNLALVWVFPAFPAVRRQNTFDALCAPWWLLEAHGHAMNGRQASR